jgi:hypothetical protein
MRHSLLTCLFVIAIAQLFAQKKNADYQHNIQRTTSAIKIDGVLDEATWQNAAVAGNFFMVLPMDTSRTSVKTDVRMAYDDDFLYIIAQNYDGAIVGADMVESLRRDWNFGKNDNFIVFIDICPNLFLSKIELWF